MKILFCRQSKMPLLQLLLRNHHNLPIILMDKWVLGCRLRPQMFRLNIGEYMG